MSVRAVHRKRVCHVHRRRRLRSSSQRSPPLSGAVALSRWDQLPLTNRQRLLHLLGCLVERQLGHEAGSLPASSEEAEDDLRR
jgi:hypothetical protein